MKGFYTEHISLRHISLRLRNSLLVFPVLLMLHVRVSGLWFGSRFCSSSVQVVYVHELWKLLCRPLILQLPD